MGFVPEHRSGDLLAMVLAIGVGCGLVADGRVLRGAHGLAGELGHMIVESPEMAAPCGRPRGPVGLGKWRTRDAR